MGLILLEALGEMVLLLRKAWWTISSARQRGELPAERAEQPEKPACGQESDKKVP